MRAFLLVLILGACVAAEPDAVPEGALALAGTWQGKTTALLPPAKNNTSKNLDPGLSPAAKEAMLPGTDDRSWETLPVPSPWSRYAGEWKSIDGEAVFRRRFTVPEAWLGQALELRLGAIDDEDLTQINGVTVGTTTAKQPGSWAFKRVYTIPAGTVHAGENLLTVRIFDQFGEGGFMGPASELYLCPVPPPAPAAAGSTGAAPPER